MLTCNLPFPQRRGRMFPSGEAILSNRLHRKGTYMGRVIAVVGGTGPEGRGLAARWARAGESIVIGSRDAQRAAEVALQIAAETGAGDRVRGTDNVSAVAGADVVVLTVPFPGQAAILKELKPAFRPGTLVIDTTVPLAAGV